jgi:GT2 family glycosyltransferase
MANNFFFSEDGLTFIDLSQISAIAQKNSSSAFYVYLRNVDGCIAVDSDTVTELFDAMHEYGIGE